MPATGITCCCARAASGHVDAPPSNVMKSRRLTGRPSKQTTVPYHSGGCIVPHDKLEQPMSELGHSGKAHTEHLTAASVSEAASEERVSRDHLTIAPWANAPKDNFRLSRSAVIRSPRPDRANTQRASLLKWPRNHPHRGLMGLFI